jgi:hypothetical protein
MRLLFYKYVLHEVIKFEPNSVASKFSHLWETIYEIQHACARRIVFAFDIRLMDMYLRISIVHNMTILLHLY